MQTRLLNFQRTLYTWKSPADKPEKIVRNQIDYLLINNRYRNAIKSTKTYPGADIYSDHVPVIARIRVRVIVKKQNGGIDAGLLKDPNIRSSVEQTINQQMKVIGREGEVIIRERWEKIQKALSSTTNSQLKSKRKGKSPG